MTDTRPDCEDEAIARTTPVESAARARAFLDDDDTYYKTVYANKYKASQPQLDLERTSDPSEWRAIGKILYTTTWKKTKGALLVETNEEKEVFGLVDGDVYGDGTVVAVTAKSVKVKNATGHRFFFMPHFAAKLHDSLPLEPMPAAESVSAVLQDAALPVSDELKTTILELEAANQTFAALFVHYVNDKRFTQIDLCSRTARGAIDVDVHGDLVIVATHDKILVDLLGDTCITVREDTRLEYNDYTGYATGCSFGDEDYGQVMNFATFHSVSIAGGTVEKNGNTSYYNLPNIGSIVVDWDQRKHQEINQHNYNVQDAAEEEAEKKEAEEKRKEAEAKAMEESAKQKEAEAKAKEQSAKKKKTASVKTYKPKCVSIFFEAYAKKYGPYKDASREINASIAFEAVKFATKFCDSTFKKSQLNAALEAAHEKGTTKSGSSSKKRKADQPPSTDESDDE